MILKRIIGDHLKKNSFQYFLVGVLFLLGVIIGNYMVSGLTSGTKSYLVDLIDTYLQTGFQGEFNQSSIWFNAMLSQAKTVLAIWFLGLTIIGFPIILALVFFRGLSIGFTIGFLINQKAVGGVMIGIISILPQHLLYTPALLIWSVIAMNFSIDLIKGIFFHKNIRMRGLISFSIAMLSFLLVFMLGSVVEAYLSPWLLRLFLSSF